MTIYGLADKDGVVRVDSNRGKDYNNVIDTIWCISESHHQIKATTVGDIWEIDLEKNTLFPLCHINPLNVIAGAKTLEFDLQILVCDLVEPHESNEQEVLSDTMQICTDLISEYKFGTLLSHNMGAGNTPAGSPQNPTHTGHHTSEQPRRYWLAESDITLEPFTERFANAVSGWVFNLRVVVQFEYQTCDIPQDINDCRK